MTLIHAANLNGGADEDWLDQALPMKSKLPPMTETKKTPNGVVRVAMTRARQGQPWIITYTVSGKPMRTAFKTKLAATRTAEKTLAGWHAGFTTFNVTPEGGAK